MSSAAMLRDAKKRLIQLLTGGRFFYRLPDRRELFLTFDDGPDPQHTPALIDILGRYGVRASFFLVGQAAERHPAIVAQLKAAGHTVGLHTHTHTTMDRMARAQFQKEITDNQSAIRNAIGETPVLLRPPQGRLNVRSLLWACFRGLRVVHYTHTSNDWKAPSAEYIRAQIPEHSLIGGEILSFHDNNPYTLEVVPRLIEACHKRGFAFAPIR